MALPTLTSLLTDLTAVTDRVTTLETLTGQQKAKDDSQNARLTTLEARTVPPDLSTALAQLAGRVAALEGKPAAATSSAVAELAGKVSQLERERVEPQTMPVRQVDLLTLLGILATRYQGELGETMGEGSTVGPRMRAELVARAKRAIVVDLVAELAKLA